MVINKAQTKKPKKDILIYRIRIRSFLFKKLSLNVKKIAYKIKKAKNLKKNQVEFSSNESQGSNLKNLKKYNKETRKMTTNVEQIIEQLKTLTLIESSELVKQIEETFGVDASAPVGGGAMVMAPGQEAPGQDVAEEKTTFDVLVKEISSDKRVAVLKVIRKLTSLGLADAKEFTVSLPKALKEGISKDEAEEAKKELEGAGATVEIV